MRHSSGIELAVLLGLCVARRGFWGVTFPNSPPEGGEVLPSLHGNMQWPDPVELFGAASVLLPMSGRRCLNHPGAEHRRLRSVRNKTEANDYDVKKLQIGRPWKERT
jgi:hypothetical protein